MRVLIAGGGNVGTFVATELLAAGHDVVIVESDPGRARDLADDEQVKGSVVLPGDACEVSMLATAEPQSADVVVAVTGDDEDNLVISLLAKQEFGVPRVVARVNNPNNEWLFDEGWGVDVSVSTPHLLAAMVEEAVSVGNLVRLLSFEHGKARLMEVTLSPDSPAIGKQLQGLGVPRDATVVAVIRQDKVVVPRGDTEFYEHDEVLLLVAGPTDDPVRRLFVA